MAGRVDIAVVFIGRPVSKNEVGTRTRSIKVDVSDLAYILQCFWKVTGLCTNFRKSSVVPIPCWNLDLEAILQGFPAARQLFL